MIKDKNYYRGLNTIFKVCMKSPRNSKILILFDETTSVIANDLKKTIKCNSPNNNVVLLKEELKFVHGREPSEKAKNYMIISDYIICLTQSSLAHTHARKQASEKGAKFLSLVNYDSDVVKSDAFKADFAALSDRCDLIKRLLDNANNIRIKTKKGTNLLLQIHGREANSAPGCLRKSGDLGSPPDVEVNIAPIENLSNGIVYVDGSIPYKNIGILKKDILMTVKDGVCEFDFSKDEQFLELNSILKRSIQASTIGELGFGLNPFSEIVGRMLEDEGAFRTFHLGIGSNSTIGGLNKCSSHIDFVIKDPIIYIDEEKIDLYSLI